MRSAYIIKGQHFDWEAGKRAMDVLEKSINEGGVSWGAAMAADPGVMQCPQCKAWYWREGDLVECLDCGAQWEP